jgi:hypothetical protein
VDNKIEEPPLLETATKQRLMKTTDSEDLVCAVAICSVCILVRILQLFVVMSHKRSINPILNPYPMSIQYYYIYKANSS